MEINYLEQHQNFKEVLEKEVNRMIADEDATVTIRNIPSLVFCDATGCEPYDYNGLASVIGGEILNTEDINLGLLAVDLDTEQLTVEAGEMK